MKLVESRGERGLPVFPMGGSPQVGKAEIIVFPLA